jgi:hypothetical protein
MISEDKGPSHSQQLSFFLLIEIFITACPMHCILDTAILEGSRKVDFDIYLPETIRTAATT